MLNLEESTLLVVGTVRDCQRSLTHDVKRIKKATVGAQKVLWFLVESDSSDNTVGILDDLARTTEDFRYASHGSLQAQIPERTDRLAHCRNLYLDELNQNPTYEKVDFVVVADFDGINKKITASGFESCWSSIDWDGCFANQSGPYYDVWTLRHPEWSPNDCWGHYRFLEKINKGDPTNFSRSVGSRMIRLPEESDWVPVLSAFGGLGVYKRDALRQTRYAGRGPDGQPSSDHVPLNLALVGNGGRLFINPKMINSRYNEHSLQALPSVRIFYRLLRSLRQIARHGFPGRF